MKNSQRITAALLALTTLLGATSCGGSGSSRGEAAATQATAAPTTTAADPNKEFEKDVDWDEMANIEEVDSSNEIGTGPAYEAGKKAGLIKVLMYYDLLSSEPGIAEIFAQRYGGTLETEITSSGDYFEKMAVLIASGTSPDLVRYDWAAYPDGVSQGRYTALDDWLDIDSPLWEGEKSVIESFTYLGKHYYFPQNAQPNFAILYNTKNIEENGLPDPYELYMKGEWNWNTFEDMLKQWAAIDENYVGFTGGSWSSMQFANTTGVKTIDMTGTDIVNNLKNQNVDRTMKWCESLYKQGLTGSGYVHPGDAFTDGTLLFLAMGIAWGIESAQECLFKNNLEGSIVALPFPRDPNSDKYYLSTDTFGYMVPAGAPNTQGAVQWILSSRLYETDPEVVAREREKKMYDGLYFYPKCPNKECKYDFGDDGYAKDGTDTCPKCGTARKAKFKPVYTAEQLQIAEDMINPDKFGLVFDNAVGFNLDFQNMFVGSEETIFDGPLYSGMTYTQIVEQMYSVVEAYLDPYREKLKQAQ